MSENRRLRKVCCNAPRLVLCEHLGRRSPPGFFRFFVTHFRHATFTTEMPSQLLSFTPLLMAYRAQFVEELVSVIHRRLLPIRVMAVSSVIHRLLEAHVSY